MTRRRVGAVVTVAAIALLAWWLWPAAEEEAPVVVAAAEVPREAEGAPRRRWRASRAPEELSTPPAEEASRPSLRCAVPAGAAEAGEARILGERVRVRSGELVLGERRLELLAAQDLPSATLMVPLGDVGGPPPRPEEREPRLLEPVDLEAFLAQPHAFDVELVGVGTARLVLPGDGTCRVEGLRRSAHVSGLVRSRLGVADDRIVVEGCGHRTKVDRDGGFYLDVDPEPCVLRASRYDGAFVTRSAPVRVDPASDEEIVLDLDLPSFRAAGVGTQIGEAEGGVLIRRVYPDTPASDAGLRPGDVVVALDGEPVDGMEAEDFVDLAVGPAGTEVTYTVLRDGEEREITMVREEMERPE